ncbi:MAG: hypothetical protein M3480_10890 [Verrucomicrobiota bacterium]|nr:hypothetical protein [Chthoniobacterales bacterium]MDQ3415454.1 hypothetical protein [Verrucomicrobiota bacterium]
MKYWREATRIRSIIFLADYYAGGNDGKEKAKHLSLTMTFFRTFLVPLALFFLAGQAAAFETAYWAWQRNESPNEGDLAQLSAQSVRTLYWHVGDLENANGSWRWKSRFRLPALPGFEVVPVLRLESRARAPFTSESMGSLGRLVSAAVGGSAKLQLDYDCPDRLLPDYAKALRAIHKIVPHLRLPSCARTGFTLFA